MSTVPTKIIFSIFLCFPCSTGNLPCDNFRNFQVSYAKLTWQTHSIFTDSKILQQISQYMYFRHNLSKQDSLCFGKISKFCEFSLTAIHPSHVFPVQWGPCMFIILCRWTFGKFSLIRLGTAVETTWSCPHNSSGGAHLELHFGTVSNGPNDLS